MNAVRNFFTNWRANIVPIFLGSLAVLLFCAVGILVLPGIVAGGNQPAEDITPTAEIAPTLVPENGSGSTGSNAGETLSPAASATPGTVVQPPTLTPSATATSKPADTPIPQATNEVLEGNNLPMGKDPEFYFPYGKIRECVSVNGPWIAAFNNGETYTIDPTSSVFPAGHYIQGEGVLVGSYPVDLHQNFVLTEKVEMSQGNFWDCGDASTMTKADVLVNLFDNNNGKYANWDSQAEKPFHPMRVITPYGDFSYEKGERPAWVRGFWDAAAGTAGIYTCVYDETELHEQDAVPDRQKIITPGSAGCDFVAIRPGNSEADRHNGVIERFEYKNGMLIFVFNPELSNSQVEEMLAENFDLDVTVVGP